MPLTLQSLLPGELFSYLLVFSRIGTTVSMLPGFGESYVSPRIRLLLALVMTGEPLGPVELLVGLVVPAAVIVLLRAR